MISQYGSVISVSGNFAQPEMEGGRISLMVVGYEFDLDFSYVLFTLKIHPSLILMSSCHSFLK